MPTSPSADRSNRLPHFPALDGIRGPFAIAVLSYHAGMGFSGALTMMTGFFALSGFLITSLLVLEWQKTGNIDLLRFVVNRARRLLPAAMVVIAIVAIAWNLLPLMTVPADAGYDAQGRLNVDLLAATFYVFNWRRAFGPEWEGFSAMVYPNPPEPSPIAHLWSLSVEEQFYALFPVVCLIALRLFRSEWAIAVAAVTGMLAVYFGAPWIGEVDDISVLRQIDRLYNGTDSRIGEVMWGVVLGVLYTTPGGEKILGHRRTIAILGLAATGVATYWTFAAQISDFWLYRGGFLLVGLVYTLIIAAAIQDRGPVVWLFGWKPFQWIGVRSYGLYLYHFPIQRWVDETLVDWGDWTLYSVRMVLTVVLTAVSYEYLELPIRRQIRPRAPLVWAVAGLAFVAVVLTCVTLGVWAPEP